MVSAAALVVDLQLAAAAAADRDPLQQRGAFADGAAGLVRARAGVASDPLAVGLEGGLVDEAGVVIPDQHLPILPAGGDASAGVLAVLVDVALPAGLAERVRAGVDGALEHAVDLVVGRDRPLDLAVREAAHRELHAARGASTATPGGPTRARRTGRRSSGSRRGPPRRGRAGSRPPPRPTPARPAAPCAARPRSALLRIPPSKPGAEHVQLGLGHRALQAQQEPVVERAGVIEPVGVADHGVGHAAQIQQPVPVDVVARQPRDLQAEHQPGVPERDLRRQPGEPGALREPRAGDPEVLVDHHDLLAREPELDRALHQRVLAGGRLDVALQLRLGGLAQVHERVAAQMRRGQLRALTPPPLAPPGGGGENAGPIRCAGVAPGDPSHNATAGAGLCANSRRNCTIDPPVSLPTDHRARPGRHHARDATSDKHHFLARLRSIRVLIARPASRTPPRGSAARCC